MSEQEIKKISPTPAQSLAMSARGADLLISAGAGSGKTATLTKRIVSRLEAGEDILRKLIVTFTKDASNELRARINGALSDILARDPQNHHIAEQIVRLGSADICTIDSFCLKIVRQSFEQLGLDGGFRIADESETEVLCRDAISEVIDTAYEQRGDDEDFLLVSDCFSGFSSEQGLKDNLLKLYRSLITTADGLKTLLKSIDLNGDFMDTAYGRVLREHIDSLCEHYIKFYDYALDEIKGDELAKKAFQEAFCDDRGFAIRLRGVAKNKPYAYISEVLSGYEPLALGTSTKVTGVDVAFYKKMRDAFKKEIRTNLKEGFFSLSQGAIASAFESNAKMCRALYSVLDEFDKEYARRKRSAGVCDFNDISRYALKLLYDESDSPTPLAGEIAQSYDEVYVDEYQDTNYIQDKIFYAVSRSNRFLVGDIKQSIYRFRSAEPEIFSAYRRNFKVLSPDDRVSPSEGGYQIAMSENFRCDKSVIDFSNAVSNYIFGGSRGIPYDKSDELKFAKLGCDYTPDKVEVYIVDKTRDKEKEKTADSEDELLRREAELVADKIKALIDEGYLANGRKIEPQDIAILLRGFKRPVELYTSALAKRGIASEYRGDEHFFEKSEVLLALCILNAIDNPLRDVYLAGAMRSGVFGFSLEDMVQIRASARGVDSFYEALIAYDNEDELGERVCEFRKRLAHYREECRIRSSSEALALIYADTSIMASASESERKSLLKLYDIARSYEAGKYKGIYGFLRYVEGIKEGSGKEELGDTGKNAVKLMSVHASKGLEFEVCFVSACGASIRVQDASEQMLFHRDLGVNTYVSRARGLAKFNTILRRCSALAIKKSSIEEEMRMLYVAMTRARSRLIITGAVSKPQELLASCSTYKKISSEYSILKPSCYLDWILQAICDKGELCRVEIVQDGVEEQETFERVQGEADEVADTELEKRLRARFAFEYPYSHLGELPSKLTVSRLHPTVLDEELGDDDDSLELEDLPSFAREKSAPRASERGTATHIFMQFCDLGLLKQNGAEAELNRLRDGAFISDESAELVSLSHIEKFRKSELFSELLSAKQIWRELRFNVMLDSSLLTENEELFGNEVLVQGVCDCIYENEAGELVLVDYKTDYVTEENYISTLTERHKNQLTYYKYAVEKIFERPLKRAIIYSVPLARIVEI